MNIFRKKQEIEWQKEILDKQEEAELISGRFGASITTNNENTIYIFGGSNDNGEYFGDLYSFNVITGYWNRLSIGDSLPCEDIPNATLKRRFSSLVLDKTNNKLWVFGGKSKVYCSDLSYFCLDQEAEQRKEDSSRDERWVSQYQLKKEGGAEARFGHTAITYNESMIIFGGFDKDGFICNDIYQWVFPTKEKIGNWIKIKTANKPNPVVARYHHSCIYYENSMFTFGGIGDKNIVFNDIWKIDFIKTESNYELKCDDWQNIKPKSKKIPPQRFGHSSCLVDNSMYIFGGTNNDGVDFNDIWTFNFSSLIWTQLQNTCDVPDPRSFQSFISCNKEMYLFGGRNSNSKQTFNDFYTTFGPSNFTGLHLLHGDAMIEFFSQLDGQTLLSCACVCKRWNSMALSDEVINSKIQNYPKYGSKSIKTYLADLRTDLRFKNNLKKLPKNVRPKIVNNNGWINLKVVIVGDGAVGKTCSLISYTTNAFPGEYIPTYSDFSVNIMLDGLYMDVGLWDTAGQEDYDRLRPLSYPQTNIFIIMFDKGSRASFNNVKEKWVPELQFHCPGTPYVLASTKHDDDCDNDIRNRGIQEVTKEEGLNMASDIKAAQYFEFSSMTQLGLKELFENTFKTALYFDEIQEKKCIVQ